MTTDYYAAGKAFLGQHGLNLFAVLAYSDLTESIRTGVQTAAEKISAAARMILIGNSGTAFWDKLTERGLSGADPVDHYSKELALRFAKEYLNVPSELLFPFSTALPLQQLGKLAGWHHDSPLGVGIHSEYGLWFAYRAVLLVDAELPLCRVPERVSPCTQCTTKPCLHACPAKALEYPALPDMKRCHDWRLQHNSPCAYTCLARLACPVAPQMRYSEAQLQYHYGHSLTQLTGSD